MEKKILGYKATLSYTIELRLDSEEDQDWLPDWLEGKSLDDIRSDLREQIATLDADTLYDHTDFEIIYEQEKN